MLAAACGKGDIVHALLETKADISMWSRDGSTAAEWAERCGQPDDLVNTLHFGPQPRPTRRRLDGLTTSQSSTLSLVSTVVSGVSEASSWVDQYSQWLWRDRSASQRSRYWASQEEATGSREQGPPEALPPAPEDAQWPAEHPLAVSP